MQKQVIQRTQAVLERLKEHVDPARPDADVIREVAAHHLKQVDGARFSDVGRALDALSITGWLPPGVRFVGGDEVVSVTTPEPEPTPEERFEQLLDLKLTELREEAKKRGLPTSGRKADLAERLVEASA